NPGIASHHAAHEGAAGQLLEAVLLERLELARGELELLRYVGYRQAALFTRAGELRSDGLSQRRLAAGLGTRASPGSVAATGWHSSAPPTARRACARCAAQATATPGSGRRASGGGRRACARRPYCPAGS